MDSPHTKRKQSNAYSTADKESQEVDRELEKASAEMLKRVASKNHYLILCLEPTASSRDIKRNYFQLIKQFHPDKTAAAQLGLDARQQYHIVRAVTAAFGVLNSPDKRKEYHHQSGLPSPAKNETQLYEELQKPISSAPATERTQASRISSAPNRQNSDSASTYPPRKGSVQPRGVDSTVALSAAVRLRENQQGSQPPLSRPRRENSPRKGASNHAPSSVTPRTSLPPGADKAQHYVHLMEEAAASKQWSSAASLGKMAQQMNPDNPSIANRQREYQSLSDRELAPQYREQAQQAQAHRDFSRAASLFERSANGLQSAQLYASAAANLKRCQYEPRKLIDLCRQAARLEPDSFEHKVSLIGAYLEAQAKKSAEIVFKQAQQLDRKNPVLKELAQKIKALN